MSSPSILCPDADLVIVDLDGEWTVSFENLYTKNKWSPFEGWQLRGRMDRTIVWGKTAFRDGEFPAGPGYGAYLTPAD